MASPPLLLLLFSPLLLSAAFPLPPLPPLPSLSPLPSLIPGAADPPSILPQPPTAAPPPPGGLTSFTGGKGSYKFMVREFIRAHNHLRKQLGERPVKWDKKLASFARHWSETRRGDCDLTHSRGPYGENMFWGTGWDWRASDAVRFWADETHYYNPVDNSCQPGKCCGHFTQMAWNSTRRVGCARVECFDGGVIMTCSYYPPGNYLGERPFNLST